MPSQSLKQWRNDRMPRLQEVENQCAATSSLVAANPRLADENLRGYTVLLSAHFQGFCRDLHTECSMFLGSLIRRSDLKILIQAQFYNHRALDQGNANLDNLRKDFKRFDLNFDLSKDPANQSLLSDLAVLNKWRNIVAHQGDVPSPGFPNLTTLRSWQSSCDSLATSLDKMMYNRLRALGSKRPWKP